MKKILILLIILPVLLISCDNDTEENPENAPEQTFQPADLMSNGFESGPDSKAMWDYQRFHSPISGVIPQNIRERELEFAHGLPANYNRDYTWTHRGPWNIGGRTRAIAIDVLDENIWLVGGVTGGIWRTDDAGASWAKVTTDDQLHSVSAITQDRRPGKQNVWYAATGEYYTIVSHSTWETRFSGNGLLKSTDFGLSWTEITSTQSNTPETIYDNEGDFDYTWRLVTDHTNLTEDVVLAAVFNGIYRSDDGGDTWTESLGFTVGGFSAPDCDYLDMVITDDGIVYATFSSDGPTKGVYRSDDGGLSWTNIQWTDTAFPTSWGRLAIATSPDPNVIWLFGDTNGSFGNGHSVLRYEYVSGDGSGTGGIWEDRSANLPDEDCIIAGSTFNRAALNTQSSFDVHLAVHPTDPDVVYIAGTSIWRSADAWTSDSMYTWIGGYGCDTITPFSSPLFKSSYDNHHPDQHYLTFLPSDDSKLINANDGGVYVTQDCLADSVKWDDKNNGYLTTQFYGVAIEHGITESPEIMGGMQDNNTYLTQSSNPTYDWVKISGGDGMFCAITDGGEYHLSTSQYGRLYLSKLGSVGNVLEYERIDPEGGPSSYNWANSLKLDPNYAKRLYWNGKNRIWRLDNLDDIIMTNDKTNKEPDHWVKIDESTVSGAAGFITDIEMAEGAPDVVWYGSSNGKLFRLDSANSAEPVQTEITGEGFPNGSWLSSISVNPYNPDNIIVCFANYEVPSIFRTTDGGLTWSDISGNLEENEDGSGSGPAVIWVEYYPNGTLFAGTTVGMYTTNYTDSTNTVWTYEPGIGNVVINHMDYRTYDGTFVVGTHGRGVFSTTLDPVYSSIGEEMKEVKLQLYPTLATDLVTIKNIDGFDSFALFDINGRVIDQWSKKNLATSMSVSHLRSGTYIFVAQSSEKREAIKFVKR